MAPSPKNVSSAAGDRFLTAACCCFFAVIPLVHTQALIDPTLLSRSVVAWGIIIAACVVPFLGQFRQTIRFGRFDALWLLYIVFSSVSFAVARDRSAALFELSKLFMFYAIFVLFRIGLARTPALLRPIALCVTCNCIFQCIVVVVQRLQGHFPSDMIGLLGIMTNANVLAENMLLSLPLCVYALAESKGRWRIVPAVGICCTLFLMIMLKCRTVWAGFIISLAAAVLVAMRTGGTAGAGTFWKRHTRLLLAAAITLTTGAIIIIAADAGEILFHVKSLLTLNLNNRGWLWEKTLAIISQNPLFGVGPGNWRLYIPLFYNEPTLQIVSHQRPHNDFLWVLSEGGVFAFFSYAAALAVAFGAIIKSFQNYTGSTRQMPIVAFFGMTAYLLISMSAFPRERIEHLIFLALFCSLPFMNNAGKGRFSLTLRQIAAAILLVALPSVFFGIQRMRAEMTLRHVLYTDNKSSRSRTTILQEINPFFYTADPLSMPVTYYQAIGWLATGDIQKGFDFLTKAYAVSPMQADLLCNLGASCEQLGKRNLAEKYFREAVATTPFHVRSKINLAILDLRGGRLHECAEVVGSIDTAMLRRQAPELESPYRTLLSSTQRFR